MALSKNTEEAIDEAVSAIRRALRSAAVNDASPVSLQLSKAMNDLELLKHSQAMTDKIEELMKENGDNPFGKGFFQWNT